MTPCAWCGLPETQHRAYRALIGWHDWEPEPHEPPIARPRVVGCDDGVTVRWEDVSDTPPEETSKRGMLERLRAAMGREGDDQQQHENK